jgi:hypothetical protein
MSANIMSIFENFTNDVGKNAGQTHLTFAR